MIYQWVRAAWIFVYLVLLVGSILWALPRSGDVAQSWVNSLSFFMNVFIPDLARMYVDNMVPLSHVDHVETTMIIHVVLTLLSCATVFAWGVAHATIGLRSGGLPWYRIILVELAPFCGFATILFAVSAPGWFMSRSAYERPDILWWFWPATVNAPITYFRTGLAVFTVVGLVAGRTKEEVAGRC